MRAAGRLTTAVAVSLLAPVVSAGPLAPFTVAGDGIPAALEGRTGDAARGRAIVLDRAVGNCLICHAVPIPAEPFQGDLGPALDGVAARLTPAQIRLRLVDQSQLNSETIMPPYYRIDGLVRVDER